MFARCRDYPRECFGRRVTVRRPAAAGNENSPCGRSVRRRVGANEGLAETARTVLPRNAAGLPNGCRIG